MTGRQKGGPIGKPGALPPAPNRSQVDWGQVADLAKNNQGQWVPIEMANEGLARSYAYRIRRGGNDGPRALRDPGFDAATRKSVLYVCWRADR